MAGVAPFGEPIVAGVGPLNRLARKQYTALATMRWCMLINNVRSVQGAFELGARTITFLIYSVMGLGLGFGLGAGAFSLVSAAKWQLLPALFWVVFVVWQVLPIAIASFQEQFDVNGLLRFPVSFASFCLLQIVFGLVDVSVLQGAICCVSIWVGIIIARPDLWAWAFVLLAAFAVFNVVLGRTVLAWIDRWLAQRKTREIVSALFLLLMLSLQLLNPALRTHQHRGARHHGSLPGQSESSGEASPWVRGADAVSMWLPPGVVVSGLASAAENRPSAAGGAVGMIGIYILATGTILAWRLRAEYRGENLGEAAARRQAGQRARRLLLDGSGPIAAVMEKELRTIPRSMPLLFAIGAPLLSVLVIATILRNSFSATGHSLAWAFPLCVSYALLGFTNMIFNNLGTEGTGIHLLFLSPTPIRTVMLAKNLFHGLLYTAVAVVAGVFAGLRLGFPSVPVLAATAACLLFAIPANLAAGNVFSLMMAFRMNPGRLSRQRGSQASALLSMLVQAIVLGVGVTVFELCSIFGRIWLAAPVLVGFGGIMLLVWFRVLSSVDSLANRNRDTLIATLAKAE